jgi:predicted DNA-binding transcriptional regulator AlpA
MKDNSPLTRRWVTDKFLSDYYQVSRVTIWAWSKNGRLPPPVKLGANTTRWDFHKITQGESAA